MNVMIVHPRVSDRQQEISNFFYFVFVPKMGWFLRSWFLVLRSWFRGRVLRSWFFVLGSWFLVQGRVSGFRGRVLRSWFLVLGSGASFRGRGSGFRGQESGARGQGAFLVQGPPGLFDSVFRHFPPDT